MRLHNCLRRSQIQYSYYELSLFSLNFNVLESMDAHQKLHLTYTHQLQEGITPTTGYGLALARTVRFPRSVVARAEFIAQQWWHGASDVGARPPGSTAAGSSTTHNAASTVRTQFSNPVNRAYPRSQHSAVHCHSGSDNGSEQLSGVDGNPKVITQLERNVYDLYANIMEVFKASPAGEHNADIADQVNSKIEEFLNVCSDQDTDWLRSTDSAVIMRRFRTTGDRDALVESVQRQQRRSQSLGQHSLRMQWFPASSQQSYSSTESAVEQRPTGGHLLARPDNLDQQRSKSRNTVTTVSSHVAGGTNLSQLSFHSLMRRCVRPPTPQLSASSSAQPTGLAHLPSNLSGTSDLFVGPPVINTSTKPAESVRTDLCGFENMPSIFWSSVDDFENGPENNALRDFINDGLQRPCSGDSLKSDNVHGRKRWTDDFGRPVQMDEPAPAKSARLDGGEVSASKSDSGRRVRFADECSFAAVDNSLPAADQLHWPSVPADFDLQDMFAEPSSQSPPPAPMVDPGRSQLSLLSTPRLNDTPPNWSGLPDWSDVFGHEDSPMADVTRTPPLAVQTPLSIHRICPSQISSQAAHQRRLDSYLTSQYERSVLQPPEQSQEISSSTNGTVSDRQQAPASQTLAMQQPQLPSFTQIEMEIRAFEPMRPPPSVVGLKMCDIAPPPTPAAAAEAGCSVDIVIPAPMGF